MQRNYGSFRDNEGRGYPGASVTVYLAGTSTLATLYSPQGDIAAPAGQANPFTTDANGLYGFAVGNGTYDIQITGGSMPTEYISNLTIGTTDITTIEASSVTNVPAGTIAATNVQDAIDEIVSDLASSSGSSLVGFIQSGSGAVARTGQDKMRESVNVDDFGLTDTDALAYATSLPNRIVRLSKRTYKVTAKTVVAEGVSIVGEGRGGSIIEWDEADATLDHVLAFTRNTGDNFSSIHGVTIDQKRSERGLPDSLTYGGILAPDHFSCTGCLIKGTSGPGITEAGIEDVMISGNEFQDNGHHPIYFSTGNLGYVKNVIIEDNIIGDTAIIVGASYPASAIKIRHSNDDDLVENVTIRNNTTGTITNTIGIDFSTSGGGTCLFNNIVVENNKLNSANDATTEMLTGIYVGATSKCSGFLISGNYISGPSSASSYGVRFLISDTASTGMLLSGNVINGVEVGIDANYAHVCNNDITFTKYGYVGVAGLFDGNKVTSPSDNAVGVRQTTSDVINNTITMGSATGTIGIDMANSTNKKFSLNTITGAAQGILRNGKSLVGCYFSENMFTSCTDNYVGFTNSAATMKSNVFEPGVTTRFTATADRPTAVYTGQPGFDTTLGIPIWWNGAAWVNSAGAVV